jgi:hypothetical protein
MSRETRLLGRIEVDVTGFFTTHHSLRTEAGTRGELTFRAFGQQGIFQTADGRMLVMQKTHWLGTAHEVVEGEHVRGTADRPGLLSRDMALQFDGQDYSLQPEGFLKQGWFLVDAVGDTLIEIQPRGILTQGAYLTIYEPVNIDLVAFVYYLYYVRTQEDAAAVAATSAAAVS